MRTFCITLLFNLLFVSVNFSQIDRSEPPEAGPAPEIRIGEYETFQLDNGLKVFVVENQKVPYVSFSLDIDRDPVAEKEKAGYLELAGNMLGTATENRTEEEINQAVDFIGADLYTSSGFVYASALKKHKEKLMDILADVTKNARFEQEELEQVKLRVKSQLKASQDQPSAIARRVFRKLIYRDHPYSEYKTQESLERITLEDIKNYYETYFLPNIAYLAVVGNTTIKEIRPLIEEYFSDWEKKEVPGHRYADPEPYDNPRVAVVHRSNAVQSTIRIGHAINLEYGSGEVIPAKVMNTILGGGAFRLFENLREEHAYTYGAFSGISPDEYIGRFVAAADVRNNATDSAITEIFREMEKLRNEPVGEEELNRAKNYMSGNFALNLEDARTIGRFALNIQRYDLPANYYNQYLKNIEKVDPATIKKAANRYIQPGQTVIVVVGNASEIGKKLEKFGKVSYYDPYGKPVKAPVKKGVPTGMTVQKVVSEYLKARGGKKKLEDLKTLRIEYEGTLMGNKAIRTIEKKAPGMYRETFSMGPNQQVLKYDGKQGIKKTARGSRKMTGEEIKKYEINSRISYLTEWEELGVEAELEGIETFHGEEVYKIKFSRGKNNWTEFFSTKTGLRTGKSQVAKSPRGEINQTIRYLDYTEKEGIKFPGKVTLDLGQTSVVFKVTKIEVNPKLKNKLFKVD